ncbi:MAG: hypothetical protein ABIN39_06885 [candidate division WOR-3 bacterium]
MKIFFVVLMIVFSISILCSEPQIIGFSDDGKHFAFYYEIIDQMGDVFTELKVFSLETKKISLFLKFSRQEGDYKDLKDIKKIFFDKYGEILNFKNGRDYLRFSGEMVGDSFILSNDLPISIKVEYQKEKNEFGAYNFKSVLKEKEITKDVVRGKVIDLYSCYFIDKGFGIAILKSREDGLEGEFTDYYTPLFVQFRDFDFKKDIEMEIKFNAKKAKKMLQEFHENNRFYPEDKESLFRYGKVLINPVDENKDAVLFVSGNLKYNKNYDGMIIIEILKKPGYYNIWYFLNGNIVKVEGVER